MTYFLYFFCASSPVLLGAQLRSLNRQDRSAGWVDQSIATKRWTSLASVTAKAQNIGRWVVIRSPRNLRNCVVGSRAWRRGETRSLIRAAARRSPSSSPSGGPVAATAAATGVVGKEEFRRMAVQLPSSENGVAADTIRVRVGNGERGTTTVGAVFFDMDDTLVLTHEAASQAHEAVKALLRVRAPHVDQSAVLRDFLKGFDGPNWDPEHKVDVSEWRARIWGKALEGQGVGDMDLARELQSCFDRERLQAFRWTTSVEQLVRSLHKQGIKVGIITNGHKQVQRAKLKACNAEELFDTIVVGGEEPNEKPDKGMFFKACDLAGCKPEESIMVGDNLKTDIQGGINAGFLSTIWVNVFKKDRPPGAPKPDHEIATFSELRQVLKHFGLVVDASE